MKTIQVTDDLQQNLRELEEESLIAIGVGDLARMISSVVGSGTALESFDEGIGLIGDIATHNADRIAALTEKIVDAVFKTEEVTALKK